MIDIYALYDHFLAWKMDDQGVLAHGHTAKYNVSKVVYHGLAQRYCCFFFPRVTSIGCGIEVYPRSLEGVYALSAIDAGEDAEQHIRAIACPCEVQ